MSQSTLNTFFDRIPWWIDEIIQKLERNCSAESASGNSPNIYKDLLLTVVEVVSSWKKI